MNSKKGVSLIELVIVIIIILIITTFSILSGNESINQATATEIYTEINSMREAANSINIKKELNQGFSVVKGEHYDVKASELAPTETDFEIMYNLTVESGDFDDLYIIYGMDENEKYKTSDVKKSYGLDAIKHTYLVNFDKSKVDLLKSVKIDKREVRTFEQIRALVDDGEI